MSFSWSAYTCLYCGQTFYNANEKVLEEDLIVHDQICIENPLVKRIKELECRQERNYGLCSYCGCLATWSKFKSPCAKCGSPKDNIKLICIDLEWARQKQRIKQLEDAILKYGNNPAGFDWAVLDELDKQEERIKKLENALKSAREIPL